VELLGEPGVEVAVAGDGGDPRAHLADELAVLADLLVHEAVGVLLDEQAEPAQDRRPRLRREARPVGLVERAPGGADGLVDLLGRRDRHPAPRDGRVRVDALEGRAVPALHPLPVDEHPVVAIEVVGADVGRAGRVGVDGHRGSSCMGRHESTIWLRQGQGVPAGPVGPGAYGSMVP
jgi:hypothetical protein